MNNQIFAALEKSESVILPSTVLLSKTANGRQKNAHPAPAMTSLRKCAPRMIREKQTANPINANTHFIIK